MKKGFSLIEIIVAVGIVALISVAATVSYSSQRVRSRETRRIQDVSTIADALRSYQATGKDLPVSATNNEKVDSGILNVLLTSGILNDIPKDPFPGGSDGVHLFCENYMYGSQFSSTQTILPSAREASLSLSAPKPKPPRVPICIHTTIQFTFKLIVHFVVIPVRLPHYQEIEPNEKRIFFN